MTQPRAPMTTDEVARPWRAATLWHASWGPGALLCWAPAPAGSGGFVPVGAGPEVTGGELSLLLAYAALWLVAFVLIWLSLRGQSRLDARIAELARKLASAAATNNPSDQDKAPPGAP